MAALEWDKVGEREYHTGTDHGVLFVFDPDTNKYGNGIAWSGLTGVTETPSGAETTKTYADNINYISLVSAESLAVTINALAYPIEFGVCDGTEDIGGGIFVGQQTRRKFALCYRTNVGTDTNADAGHMLHIVYGLTATPSERAYSTVNESPEAMTFSWSATASTVPVRGKKPTSLVTIPTRGLSSANLTKITDKLWGSDSGESTLLMPDELVSLVQGG